MFRLDGKKALVTGATGGIGEAIVSCFHKQGAEIVASGTNIDKLGELCQKFEGSIHQIACDLSDVEQVEGLVSKAASLMSGINILVCNAGITKDNLTMRIKNDAWDQVLNINLKSSFILNRNVLSHFLKKGGRIINVASVVAVTGNPGQANYCAAKAGMIGMTKSIAREVATRNITANCIAPGFIETAMTSGLSDKQRESIFQSIPTKSMGKPEDIASAALYLASDEARYVTGQTIHVNGGMVMI